MNAAANASVSVRRSTSPLLVLPLVLFQLPAAAAAADPPPVVLETVAAGLGQPTAIAHSGDPRLFVSLKEGRVLILRDGEILPRPFLDITDRVLSATMERGLGSIAFHPQVLDNGFLFAVYTGFDGAMIVARFAISEDPDLALPASEKILLRIAQPAAVHNGGQLQFGPEGYLYAGSGDGGSQDDRLCRAQADDTLLGKILRLDVDRNAGQPPYYGIPPDNPFAGPGDPLDEIWAKGLRNPWRFSFDRVTGDLYVADVGNRVREEVNLQPAASPGGQNYGWKVLEGTQCFGDTEGCDLPLPACDSPALTPPILEYVHGTGCAVIGGYVYRGSGIPGLEGFYVYGDFCAGKVWAAERLGESWETHLLDVRAQGLTSFGEDVAGELYLAAGDSLLRLAGVEVPSPGMLELGVAELAVDESAGEAAITVERTDGQSGRVTVDYATVDGSAVAGEDYLSAAGTLAWDDGDSAAKDFAVSILDDAVAEDDSDFRVTLQAPTGGALIGARSTARITIVDDDGCQADAATLCLVGRRFQASIRWRTAVGDEGSGTAVPLTDGSGYFWFFDPGNPEVFVKVLDACVEPLGYFWVFAAGLTDVETSLTVTDLEAGPTRRYDHPLGIGFEPIRDTLAFDTCP